MACRGRVISALVWIGLAVGLAVAVLGCSSEQRRSGQREQSGLKTLAILYMQFVSQNKGKAPADEAEFKAFIRKLPESQQKSFGIKDVDSLFVSDRDGKPYVMRYGAAKTGSLGPQGPSSAPVVGYEQVGSGGRRYVASALGAVEEVDEAAFKQRVPDAKSP
jgi:hypothetical protein